MYVGHLAVALAATRVRREAPLWILLLASQWPDWIQLALGALGAYNAQLYSHSLPAVTAGALLFTLLYLRTTGDGRSAWLIAGVYLSHPLLDLVTGGKVWWPGGPMVGACLYERPAVDFIVEGAIAGVGWLIYRSTKVHDHRHRRPLQGILVILLASQAALDLAAQIRLLRNPRNSTKCSHEVGRL